MKPENEELGRIFTDAVLTVIHGERDRWFDVAIGAAQMPAYFLAQPFQQELRKAYETLFPPQPPQAMAPAAGYNSMWNSQSMDSMDSMHQQSMWDESMRQQQSMDSMDSMHQQSMYKSMRQQQSMDSMNSMHQQSMWNSQSMDSMNSM
jgi:hypothetical protein